MLGGDSGIGEEGDRIQLKYHRLPGLLEAPAQGCIVLEQPDPADKTGGKGSIRGQRPDRGKEHNDAAGLRSQAARGAKSLGTLAQIGLRSGEDRFPATEPQLAELIR